MRRGDLASARELVESSHEIHSRNGDWWGQAQTIGTMGAIARDAGDAARAREFLERSVALAGQASGFGWWQGGMLAELAMLSLHVGNTDEAETLALQSMRLAEANRDRPGRIFTVGILATVAAERGDAALAGRLWGVVESEDAGAPLGGWRRHREFCHTRIGRVARPDFDHGQTEGRALTLEDAVSRVLASARQGVPPT